MEQQSCVKCTHPQVTDPCCVIEGGPHCHTHGVRELATMTHDERKAWFRNGDNWTWGMTADEAFEMVKIAEMEMVQG